ncbi:MAG: CotS family spore coat protein [Bacillota bacterium]|nr:CotS family spore coat protein [Bacillota bacterium]
MRRVSEWTTRELSAVVGEFGLQPVSFTPVRRAWRVDTVDGPRFLKCTTLTAPELTFVAAALDYLRRRGEPAPQLELDCRGRPWVERQGYAFLLTDWVDGREAHFPDPADLVLAVEAVAYLHLRGEGFRPPPAGHLRVEWGRWPERFGRRAVQLQVFREAARAAGGRVDRAYLALWPYHFEQARKALKLLESSAYPFLSAAGRRRPVICHHDLSERNFLLSGGGVRLIDFDYCLYDFPAHDLANFLQRQAQAEDWEAAPAQSALRFYERVRPLQRGERRLLLALLIWPHRYWLLGWQRYTERLLWPEERWLDALAKRAEEAELREEYLAGLRAELGER